MKRVNYFDLKPGDKLVAHQCGLECIHEGETYEVLEMTDNVLGVTCDIGPHVLCRDIDDLVFDFYQPEDKA